MNINILYFDDEQPDLDRFGALIEENSSSHYNLIVEKIIGTMVKKNPNNLDNRSPDLILADFDYSHVDSEGDVLGMNGVTLSNLFRQKFPHVPIVLFTRKPYEQRADFPHNEAILACIDDTKYKEDLIPPNHSNLIRYLISIASGYKKLRETEPKNWDNLTALISAPESSYDLIKMSYPIEQAKRKTWTAFEAATWIRKILLKFPGIVYEPVFAATFLGITLDSFQVSEVQTFFNPARYYGVFSDENDRWWKSKLIELASQNMNDTEKNLPLRKGFIKYWNRTHSQSLTPSICEFKGDCPAETVCYLSKRPSLLKYSLHYHVDARPEVMEDARVSFKSIQTRDDVNFDLFDEVAKEIIAKRNLKP